MPAPSQTPSRPQSMLMRTASKQSLVTLYSNGEGSEGYASTASTSITDISVHRDSVADYSSLKSLKSPTESLARIHTNRTDKDLHTQIEDLLLALTEMQREHATLAVQLQREREERNDDRMLVQSLVNHLKEKPKTPAVPPTQHLNVVSHTRRKTISEMLSFTSPESNALAHLSPELGSLVKEVDQRMVPKSKHNRKSSGYETKAQLMTNLANAKEQLQMEASQNHELARQMAEKDIALNNLYEELAKARARIKNEHSERERLQRTVMELRQSGASTPRSGPPSRSSSVVDEQRRGSNPDIPQGDGSPTSLTSPTFAPPGSTKGLREFRLGRTLSAQPPPKRTTSLAASAMISSAEQQCYTPPPADEQLLQELVNAKTSEAVARQELEELKAKFEGMKRMLGVATAPSSATTSAPTSATLVGRLRAGSLTGSTHSTASGAASFAESPDELPAPVAVGSSFFARNHETPAAKAGGSGAMAPPAAAGGWGAAGGFFSSWGRRTPSTSSTPVNGEVGR